MAADVFAMRQCFPEQQIPTMTTVLHVANALRSIGIEFLQDMSTQRCEEIDDALQCLSGIGEHTARRLLMYTGGDEFVLADSHVRGFVASAVGRDTIASDVAETLVRSTAYELILSPRYLDREIWLHRLSH